MKALAYLQQKRFFFRRFQGQFGITPPEIVDLRKRFDYAFGFPCGGIMIRR
jgi:hypothetical protein